jgi:hypothetical protein
MLGSLCEALIACFFGKIASKCNKNTCLEKPFDLALLPEQSKHMEQGDQEAHGHWKNAYGMGKDKHA